MRQIWLSALCASALLLAGCGPARPPVDATGLKRSLGSSLIGVKGKTANDQLRIDVRVERECAAGLWKAEC